MKSSYPMSIPHHLPQLPIVFSNHGLMMSAKASSPFMPSLSLSFLL